MWMNGLKVFFFGFSGVFIGLIILMISIKLMSAVIRKLETQKNER